MANKEMAGKVLCEFEFRLEKGKITEFVRAIGEENKIYTDTAYAREKGFNDVLMPATYLTSFPHHVPSENFVVQAMEQLEMNKAASVHGECEVSQTRPLCAGEVLQAVASVGKITEKRMAGDATWCFVELDFSFRDQDGESVAAVKNTFIEMGR